jgi:hypothetical protein
MARHADLTFAISAELSLAGNAVNSTFHAGSGTPSLPPSATVTVIAEPATGARLLNRRGEREQHAERVGNRIAGRPLGDARQVHASAHSAKAALSGTVFAGSDRSYYHSNDKMSADLILSIDARSLARILPSDSATGFTGVARIPRVPLKLTVAASGIAHRQQ